MIHLGGDVDQKALLWWFMFPICMVNFLLNLKLYPLSKVKTGCVCYVHAGSLSSQRKKHRFCLESHFSWKNLIFSVGAADLLRYVYIYTLWLFNVAMAIDGPFMDDFPTKTPMKNRDFPRLCWITRWYIYIYLYSENLSLPVFCHIPNISKSPNSNQVSSPTLPFAIHLVFPSKKNTIHPTSIHKNQIHLKIP